MRTLRRDLVRCAGSPFRCREGSGHQDDLCIPGVVEEWSGSVRLARSLATRRDEVYHRLMATNPINPDATARVEVEYCAQCGFLPRAVWLAQELLNTFSLELRELVLVPGKGGILEVRVDGQVVYNRQDASARGEGFVDPKVLKQTIRDRVAPGRSLGHSDR